MTGETGWGRITGHCLASEPALLIPELLMHNNFILAGLVILELLVGKMGFLLILRIFWERQLRPNNLAPQSQQEGQIAAKHLVTIRTPTQAP